MKNLFKGVLGASAALILTAGVAHSDDVTLNVDAEFLDVASASVSTNINFGELYADPAGDTITMDSSGTITGALGSSGSPTAGSITVARSASVSASISTTLTGMSLTCGTDTVTFTPSVDESACATAGTGSCDIMVYGDLDVPADVDVGACTTGTLSLTVAYSS